MSSTDGKAGRLFDAELAPLAARLRERGRRFLEPGPDPAAASYFIPAPRPRADASTFRFPGDGDVERFVDELGAYWAAGGDEELCALVPGLKEVAREAVRAIEEDEEAGDGELSPFIYTMF